VRRCPREDETTVIARAVDERQLLPEKDIAAPMHHASRTTTARYLHSDGKSRAAAIAAMPDLSYPQRHRATGTHGKSDPACPALAQQCGRGRTLADKTAEVAVAQNVTVSQGESRISRESKGNDDSGPLAELADAVDSKSTARKGVSVRVR
jgi:hypothetical protein